VPPADIPRAAAPRRGREARGPASLVTGSFVAGATGSRPCTRPGPGFHWIWLPEGHCGRRRPPPWDGFYELQPRDDRGAAPGSRDSLWLFQIPVRAAVATT